MKRIAEIFILFLVLSGSFPASGQRLLGDSARISVLTSAPHDGAVFTVYGHSAFRVHDPSVELDIVFNYGIFDYSQSDFIYRFAKGETDYKLGYTDYLNYIFEYQMRGSSVTEQVLNLTNGEVNALWKALIINAQPENAVYRYNFFFDNCATRIPAMVEKYVEGEVIYNNTPEQLTFRDMINDCTRNHPWLTFGCALALGSPTDRKATPHEMMFLPRYVLEEFADATLKSNDGNTRKLVKETFVIEAENTEKEGTGWLAVFTPLLCSWILFLLVSLLTYAGWKRKKAFLFIDIFLFAFAGIAGIVLYFLCFVSVHPSIWPNWSALWIHPLHLAGAILFCINRWKKGAYYYHFINFTALTLMLAGWYFIPQHLNPAFIPLIGTLWVRSWHGVCMYKRKVK